MNFAAIVFLLASIAIAGIWIRSHWRTDSIFRQATPVAVSVVSSNGKFTLAYREYSGLTLNVASWHVSSTPAVPLSFGNVRWTFAGFARADWNMTVDGFGDGYALRDEYWTIPYWFLLVMTLTLPAIWIRVRIPAHVARVRLRSGYCAACGYDLRGSPGRCPECGLGAVQQV